MGITRISLQLEEALVTEAQEWVGQPDLSSYIGEALRRQLQQERLIRLLDDMNEGADLEDPEIQEGLRRLWGQSQPEASQLKGEQLWQHLEELGRRISEDWEGNVPPSQILSEMRR